VYVSPPHPLTPCLNRPICSQPLESFVYLRAVQAPTAYDVTILLYGALLGCLWLWSLASGLLHAHKARRLQTIYTQALQLSDTDISTCEWAAVTQRLQQPQVRLSLGRMGIHLPSPPAVQLRRGGGDVETARGSAPIQLRLEQYMAMRLMRRDNFLVALVSDGSLNLTHRCRPCSCLAARRRPRVPLPMSSSSLLSSSARVSPSYGAVPAPGQGGGYNSLEGGPDTSDDDTLDSPDGPCAFTVTFPVTSSLEWNLRASLLEPMFGGKQGRLRSRFTADARPWRTNLQWLAVINFVMLPITVPCSVVYFAIRHAEDWHAKKDVLGPRSWSHTAKWAFREYNELPHLFTRRLHAGLPYAASYIKQFPAPRMATLGKGVAFIAGTVVLALVLLTLLDDQLLLNVTLGDRNLLWYLALASAVLAGARGLVPAPEDSVVHPDSAMTLLVRYTHHYPDAWRGAAGAYHVRDAFMALFPYRLTILLAETASILTAPFVLWCVLPRCAPAVSAFLRDNHTHVPGAGDFCTQSLFDMGDLGLGSQGGASDPRGGKPPPTLRRRGITSTTMGPAIVNKTATASAAHHRTQQLKMHRSVLSFHAAYPGWSQAVTGAGGGHSGATHGAMAPAAASSILESLWQQQQQGAQLHGMNVSGIGLQVRGGGVPPTSSLLASVLTVAQGGQLPDAGTVHGAPSNAQSELWGGGSVAGGGKGGAAAVGMTALQRSVVLQDLYTSAQLRREPVLTAIVPALPASVPRPGIAQSDSSGAGHGRGPSPQENTMPEEAFARYSPPLHTEGGGEGFAPPAVLLDEDQGGRVSPGGVVSYEPPAAGPSGGQGLHSLPTPLREDTGGRRRRPRSPPAMPTARAHMYDQDTQAALRGALGPTGVGSPSAGVGLLRYMLPDTGAASDSE